MKDEKNELQVFKFENREVRTVIIDGEPWWVAKDVAENLGYSPESNPARLFANVPEEWRGVKPIHTPGGLQNMLCISEQGLYFFLGRSDKPKALPFQKWIAGDVIPSIRKKGTYTISGDTHEEQVEEWKKTCPYPFFTAKDFVPRSKEIRQHIKNGTMTIQEARRILLGDFGKYKPENDLVNFIQNQLVITGKPDDYVLISELYARYAVQVEKAVSRHKMVLRTKASFPCLEYKQKKIDGYPQLVFCGCKWANVKIEEQSA